MAGNGGKGKSSWTTARKLSNANADTNRKTRKELNRSVQEAAAKRNKVAQLGTTPWELAKKARFKKRHA